MIPFFSAAPVFTGFIANKMMDGADISMFIGLPIAAAVYWLLTRNLDVAAETELAKTQQAELEMVVAGQ